MFIYDSNMNNYVSDNGYSFSITNNLIFVSNESLDKYYAYDFGNCINSAGCTDSTAFNYDPSQL